MKKIIKSNLNVWLSVPCYVSAIFISNKLKIIFKHLCGMMSMEKYSCATQNIWRIFIMLLKGIQFIARNARFVFKQNERLVVQTF